MQRLIDANNKQQTRTRT